jgi:hypothetical protein
MNALETLMRLGYHPFNEVTMPSATSNGRIYFHAWGTMNPSRERRRQRSFDEPPVPRPYWPPPARGSTASCRIAGSPAALVSANVGRPKQLPRSPCIDA